MNLSLSRIGSPCFTFFPRRTIYLAAVLLSLLFSTTLGAGTIYRWTDKDGHVHMTDNPSEIPEDAKREILEKQLSSETPSADDAEKKGPPGKGVFSPTGGERKQYRIPLIQSGMNYLVEVRINNSVDARLMVDTGASLTAISTLLAGQLGIHDYADLPKYPFRTAGGIIWDPLVTLDRMEVEGVWVEDVEASITSKLVGVDGLLGMSFLNEFDAQLDVQNGVLVLTPYSASDAGTYGERPQRWWVRKYEYYTSNIKNFENLKTFIEKAGKAYFQTPDIDHYANVQRILAYYQDSLEKLDIWASQNSVPLEWRGSQ